MTTTKSTKRAGTYVRISDDKTGVAAGVGRQRKDTDAVCEANGFVIVRRFEDNDRSASKYARKAREGWDDAMAALASGEIDVFVAYNLDRLTRQPDQLSLLIAAADRGQLTYTCDGLVDLSNSDGIFTARVLLAVAEKESGNISRRVKRANLAARDAGKPHWVRRPFGFERDGSHVAHEAAIVRAMYGWAMDGMSATKIAERLNADGVVKPQDGAWSAGGIRLLLLAPRNYGVLVHNGKIIGPGAWLPIVDEATFRAAGSALAARARGKRGGRRGMLTGLVKCERCGGTMYRSKMHTRQVYRCSQVPGSTAGGCDATFSGADELEAHVVAMALDVLGSIRAAKSGTRANPVDDVAALRAELDDLAAMAAGSEIGVSEYRILRAPLAARLTAAEKALAHHDGAQALANMVGASDLATRWPDLDPALQRRILGTVLDAVTIAPHRTSKPGRQPIDFTRITPVWSAEPEPMAVAS